MEEMGRSKPPNALRAKGVEKEEHILLLMTKTKFYSKVGGNDGPHIYLGMLQYPNV
jgi:hypothetical protein